MATKRKAPEERLKRGRKTKFEDEKTLEVVYKLALLGCTDEEMADILKIAPSTFSKWKLDFPEFSETVTRGKILADAEIANSLHERAKGFTKIVKKPMQIGGAVVMIEAEEFYPPDTKAATIWLTNRHGRRWKDKQEVEHKVSDLEQFINGAITGSNQVS